MRLSKRILKILFFFFIALISLGIFGAFGIGGILFKSIPYNLISIIGLTGTIICIVKILKA